MSGKLMVTKHLNEYKIKICAIQETRFLDENKLDYENYKILKGKSVQKVGS